MIRPLACAALTLICVVTAAPAWAQSLGDVARKEAERRTTAKKAVKSFSNADLNPSEISNPSAAPAATEAVGGNSAADNQAKPAAGSPATDPNAAATQKEPAAAPREQKEPEWRANAEALRQLIDKAQADYAKSAALAADTSRSPGERAGTSQFLAQQARALEGLERNWQRLEKQAEALRVPRTWLDPRPIFAPRIPR